MWEPGCAGTNSSGTSVNGSGYNNRGVLLLLTVLLACVLLYKAWGPLLLITFALVLVVHTCYSLLVNDSLLAPYTLVLLDYIKELCIEAIVTFKLLSGQGIQKSKEYYRYLSQWYTQWCAKRNSEQQLAAANIQDNMNGRHRNVYRLSTANDLAEQVSPLNNDPYQSFALNGACNVGRTSTPLPRELIWRKGAQVNGDLGQFTPISNPQNKKASPLRSENKQPTLTLPHNEETVYSPKGSPWGKSISPKMKGKDSGIKTVQTVAGPLLTSTRFNVDPKLYSDINSPGLSSRLTKYASEANSKLTHQHQYGAGQFPKVNLNASPTPLLSPKVVRSRMPVTVRVAPPEITTYCPPDIQNQEKFKSISPLEAKESVSAPNVAKALKKISLKRHASREDIMLELAKKQRSEMALHEDRLENLEEMMQKRAREESITSEEDLSPQSKNERPLKRPKAASSCHDILNSLSSSLHVFSGVKRKAMDSSRSSTPDIEKHFKPSSRSPTIPTRTMSLNILPSREPATSKEQLNVKIPNASASGEPYQQKPQVKSPEIKKTVQHSPEKAQSQTPKAVNVQIPKIHKEISVSSKTEKLTDKLFMRAEPQSKEKLKDLINDSTEEAKFITDDKDEIKKQDITNMRQNSIRLRLQSMANAISGKSVNKIDPGVVIQAEEMNRPTSSPFTSLSTLTTTTTVNTSPITTTLVPILKTDTESKLPTPKHVTFNLPSSTLSFNSTTSITSTSTCLSALTSNELAKPVDSKPVGTSSFGGFGSTTNSAPPSYNFGSNVASSVTSAAAAPTSTISNSTSSGFALSSNIAASNNIPSGAASTMNTNASSNSSLFAPKSTANTVSAAVSTSTPGFSFGNAAKSTLITTAATSSTSTISFGTQKTIGFTSEQTNSISSTMTPTFGSSLTKSPAATSFAPTTSASALPTFGGDKKTGGSSFSAPSSSNTSSTTASIFGASSSAPMFSASSNALTAVAASAPAATTAPPSYSFGSAADKPASTFSFGGSATASTSTPASTQPPSIIFGSGGQTLGSSSTTSAAPAFGAPAPASIASNSIVSAPNSTFGNSVPSVFGASTNSPSLFSGTSNSPAMFKSPATTAATTTPASIFGSGTSGFGASSAPSSASSTPSLFGNNPSVTTSSTPSLFGNAANAATANASSTASPFGGSVTQQQGNIFSGMSGATTTSSSIFGSTSASSSLFSGSGSTTGQVTTNMTPTVNATVGGSVFDQAKSAPNLSFGATTSTFGSSNPSTTFAAPSTNNTTSAFQIGSGTPTSASLPAFGTIKPSMPTNSGSSIFGSTAGGGFGATSNPAPPAFGSTGTGNAFGMPSNANTAPPAFGTNASSFGNSTGTSSPFAAPATTSTPSLFGSAASGATTSAPTGGSASFSFGSSPPTQQQLQQSQQSTASFSFGGTSTNTNTGGGFFQFGASNAPKPGGFNFGAPTSAPTINFTAGSAPPAFNAGAPGAAPAFNAAPPNMFSIGSGGSSTSRSRTSRPRRGR